MRIFIIIMMLLWPIFSFGHEVGASSCETLQCVRSHIDHIDAKLVNLIGERLTYVKRAGQLKRGHRAIVDKAREKRILKKIAQQAIMAGYPPSIGVAIFEAILHQSVIYEQQ